MLNDKSRYISTIIWYLILTAVIYFINFSILNYAALLVAAWLITGSILDKSDKKMLLFKILLTALLLVVYYFR